MSIKAVGIAIKLTIEGINQAGYFQTWVFAVVSATCIVIQLVYLNKVCLCPISNIKRKLVTIQISTERCIYNRSKL
jgi:hypothetical protein